MVQETSHVAKWRLYSVATAFTIFVGFSFFGIKKCIPYADSLTIITYRYLTALVAMLILLVISRRSGNSIRPRTGKFRSKLYMAVAFYILFMFLQILAMFFATSIEGAIVYAMIPIFAKIIGRIALHERSTGLQILFVTTTVSALIVLVLLNAKDINMNFTGLLIMTFSSISMACENVTVRYIRGVYQPIDITVTIIIDGAILFAGISFVRAVVTKDFASLIEPLFHIEFVIWVSFLGVCCILLCAQFMAYMLAHMEIVQSSVFSSAATLVSIIAGACILGEPLQWYHYLCGTLIMVGVAGLLFSPTIASANGKSLSDRILKE